MRLPLSATKYPDDAAALNFYERLLERVRGVAGIQSAAAGSRLPLGFGTGWGKNFSIEGRPLATSLSQVPNVDFVLVSPDYFRTAGIKLLSGREFTAQDTEKAPQVAIISETIARRFFANEEPVGKRIWMGPPENLLPAAPPGHLEPGRPGRGPRASRFASPRRPRGRGAGSTEEAVDHDRVRCPAAAPDECPCRVPHIVIACSPCEVAHGRVEPPLAERAHAGAEGTDARDDQRICRRDPTGIVGDLGVAAHIGDHLAVIHGLLSQHQRHVDDADALGSSERGQLAAGRGRARGSDAQHGPAREIVEQARTLDGRG